MTPELAMQAAQAALANQQTAVIPAATQTAVAVPSASPPQCQPYYNKVLQLTFY